MGFETDGAMGCMPLLPAECAAGLIAVPGDATCRPVLPCPRSAGPYDGIPVDAATQHVALGGPCDAPGPGCGSPGSPWASVQLAVAAAAPGAVVALAPGDYAESVVLDSAVRLWGRCPDEVALTGAGAPLPTVRVAATASGAELHGVSITGAARGIEIAGATGVVLDRVWVHDTGDIGVAVDGGAASLTGSLVELPYEVGLLLCAADVSVDGSVIRGARMLAGQSDSGQGIHAEDASTPSVLTMTGSVVEASAEDGINVLGSDATISASVVRDGDDEGIDCASTELDPRRFCGASSGVRASTLTLSQSVVSNNRDKAGLRVRGTTALVETTVVRDTRPQGMMGPGRGIHVHGGPVGDEVRIRESLVAENSDIGIVVFGASVVLEGVVVRDTASSTSTTATGISASFYEGMPASVDLRGGVVERNQGYGILLNGVHGTLESVVLQDTTEDDEGYAFGLAIGGVPGTTSLYEPSDVTLKRSALLRNAIVGMAVAGSKVTCEDVLVRETFASSTRSGSSLFVVNSAPITPGGGPAEVDCTGLTVESTQGEGVFVAQSTLRLVDSAVRTTVVSAPATDIGGIGIYATHDWPSTGPDQTLVDLAGCAIEDNERAGVFMWGGTLSLQDCTFSCNGVDIAGAPASYIDDGANTCGCMPRGGCAFVSQEQANASSFELANQLTDTPEP